MDRIHKPKLTVLSLEAFMNHVFKEEDPKEYFEEDQQFEIGNIWMNTTSKDKFILSTIKDKKYCWKKMK